VDRFREEEVDWVTSHSHSEKRKEKIILKKIVNIVTGYTLSSCSGKRGKKDKP